MKGVWVDRDVGACFGFVLVCGDGEEAARASERACVRTQEPPLCSQQRRRWQVRDRVAKISALALGQPKHNNRTQAVTTATSLGHMTNRGESKSPGAIERVSGRANKGRDRRASLYCIIISF